jgi:hypothetical protein
MVLGYSELIAIHLVRILRSMPGAARLSNAPLVSILGPSSSGSGGAAEVGYVAVLKSAES